MADAIRGGASLVVTAAHAYQVFLYPLAGDGVFMTFLGGAATWSVATFFLLSGILIAFSIRRRSGDRFDFEAFFQARALRIYPPLIASVAVTVIVWAIINGLNLYGATAYMLPGDLGAVREAAILDVNAIPSTVALTYNLVQGHTYLGMNGPLWSLSFEWWIYVLAGLLAAAFLGKRPVALLPAGVLLWLMIIAPRLTVTFLAVGAVWGAGFCAGWNWSTIRQWPRIWLAFALVGVVALAVLVAGPQLATFLVAPYATDHQNVFYVLISSGILAVIILAMQGRRRAPRWLASTGSFSYTLYLVHFPLMLLTLSVVRPAILPFGWMGHAGMAVIGLLFAVAAASLLAKVVENKDTVSRLLKLSMKDATSRP
jgi:peptidoglycan/LPS O-acetylase OafA/YrhL